MNNKATATIVFRALGLASIVYAIFFTPYLLFCAAYSNTFITSGLLIMTYVAAGVFLLAFSKRLAAFVLKRLE
jgi:uncharacterized membrane protein